VPRQEGGAVTLVGQPIGLSRTPATYTKLLPEAGADNEGVLGELGFDAERLEELRRERVI